MQSRPWAMKGLCCTAGGWRGEKCLARRSPAGQVKLAENSTLVGSKASLSLYFCARCWATDTAYVVLLDFLIGDTDAIIPTYR